jgi:hypothetical protein
VFDMTYLGSPSIVGSFQNEQGTRCCVLSPSVLTRVAVVTTAQPFKLSVADSEDTVAELLFVPETSFHIILIVNTTDRTK